MTKEAEEKFQRAISALQRGVSILAAAQEAGISERCLSTRLCRAGGRDAFGIPPTEWAKQQERGPLDMARLLLAGASQGSIGLQWGVSANVLKGRVDWLKANGYLPKGFRAFNSRCLSDTRHDAAIAAATAAGETPEQIATRLFVPLQFVQYRITRISRPRDNTPLSTRDIPPPKPKGWLVTEEWMAAKYAQLRQNYGGRKTI